MKMNRYKQKAFTLLEILLVTVVIAIMTVAFIAFLKHYASFVMQKRTAQDIDNILDQAVTYHLYYNVWPLSFDDMVNKGLFTETEQCSPWRTTGFVVTECKTNNHQNYVIETNDAYDKKFTVSLTLDAPEIINSLSGKIPNSSVVNTNVLQAMVVSPELIQEDTGDITSFGYTRNDDKNKYDGNGKNIYLVPCSSGVPVVFHAPYQFEGPYVLWRWMHASSGVWGSSQAMAYPINANVSFSSPPEFAKLCTLNKSGSVVSGSVMSPGTSARHRFFTTCLPEDVVKTAYAPPYGSFNEDGNNVMKDRDDYEWCQTLDYNYDS